MEIIISVLSFTASILNFVKGWMISSKPTPDHTVSHTYGGTGKIKLVVKGENSTINIIHITHVENKNDTS